MRIINMRCKKIIYDFNQMIMMNLWENMMEDMGSKLQYVAWWMLLINPYKSTQERNVLI